METHSQVRSLLLTAIFILTEINASTADIKFKKTFVNNIIDINETNWKEILEDEWLIEFQTPRCPGCKSLEDILKELSRWSTNLRINIGQVDITSSPGLRGRFSLNALPTTYHVIKGEFRQYKGPRDRDSLIAFIENKVWKNVEPAPVSTCSQAKFYIISTVLEYILGWRSPDTLLMTVVSGFFKLFQIVCQMHSTLMKEYGLFLHLIFVIIIICTAQLFAVLREKNSVAEEVAIDESQMSDDDSAYLETDDEEKSIVEEEE